MGVPFTAVHGTPAVVASLVIAAVLCAVVALIRPERGWRAFALSYGITAVAAVLCLAPLLLEVFGSAWKPLPAPAATREVEA